MKPKGVSKQRKLTEYQEHKIIWQWVIIMARGDKRFLNVRTDPSQGNRSWAHTQMLKSCGFGPGFPDIGVYYPSHDRKHPALFIELKSKHKGAGPTHHQIDWIRRLIAAGYRAEICYGADAAINLIKEHFGIRQG